MKNLTYTFLIPFVAIMFLFTSCMNEIFLSDREYVDEYRINELDLLIVMDNSPSMSESTNTLTQKSKIATVSESIHNFIESYTQNDNNINYRIGITLTNLPIRKITHPTFSYYPGQLITDVITSDFFDINLLRSALNQVTSIATFDGIEESNNSILIEKGFSSAYEVASRSSEMTSNFRNTGFYKKENDFAVLLITDEDDSSDGGCSTNESCLAALKSLKSNSGSRITFHAIGDDLKTCHVNSSPHKDFNPGAVRIKDMVSLTGGEFTRMCNDKIDGKINLANLTNFFKNMGKNLRNKFKLTIVPNLETLKVEINGSLQTIDVEYTYSHSENAIIFNNLHVPRLGDRIKISYGINYK